MRTPVVVVHHRAPAWCAATCASLQASRDLDPAIVVVDNSGDLDPATLPSGVEVVVAPANLGYAGGANLGLKVALAASPDARHVVVCAHDLVPAPGTLAALVAALAATPDLGVVGPRLTAPTAGVGGRWNGWGAFNRPPRGDEPALSDCDWVSGTCLVVRTACLQAVGGFDEGFGSYVEDVDLCLRARDAGWRVACLTTVTAQGRGSASADRTALAVTNAVLLVAKRAGARAGWLALRHYLWRGLRAGLGAAALHRPAARRRVAARYARGHLVAVVALARGGRITAYAADPSRHVPSLMAQDSGATTG